MNQLGQGSADEDGNIASLEGFDFEAIKQIQPFPEAEALAKAEAALEAAGLRVQGGSPVFGHSRFEAVDTTGTVIADVKLDTHVDFESVTPNGFALKGPGADVKVVFDSTGRATQLNYAFRILAEGERTSIISSQTAQLRASAEYFDVADNQIALRGQCAAAKTDALGTLCLESELVYYAPPIGLDISQVVPHYLFKGDFTIEGNTVAVRNLLIPAVENAPNVSLTMSVENGNTIKATASASGGQAPYSYAWASSSTALNVGNSSSLSYGVQAREALTQETLSVVVTDANGVSSWTQQSVPVDLPAPVALVESLEPLQDSKVSIGSSWIGLSQGLPYASANTDGLLNQFRQADIPIAFNRGELSAHQRDFAKATDDRGVDSVDFAFYTGHAYGLGFFFESLQERKSFTSDQASWGETDLEWIMIAACGPLQEVEAGIPWWRQWGGAFNGLHLMLAYANITYDNDREGGLFAQQLLTKGLSLRQAWAIAATDVQTPTEIYALMGVFGESNVNNYNDHFWGYGTVGPDIPAEDIQGYWRLTGPS